MVRCCDYLRIDRYTVSTYRYCSSAAVHHDIKAVLRINAGTDEWSDVGVIHLLQLKQPKDSVLKSLPERVIPLKDD